MMVDFRYEIKSEDGTIYQNSVLHLEDGASVIDAGFDLVLYLEEVDWDKISSVKIEKLDEEEEDHPKTCKCEVCRYWGN